MRRRLRHPKKWSRQVRKRNREAGESYTSSSGREQPRRKSNATCCKGCTFNCSTKIIKEEQVKIFDQFWRLNDEKKLHFYSKFVVNSAPIRKRTEAAISRRKTTFGYFFEIDGERSKVCQNFFLTTLSISQTRIYYFFKNNFDKTTGVAKSPRKGKHVKFVIPNESKEGVRSHINSFPRVESHYCRSSTQKEYLDQRLSIPTMYKLYLASEFTDGNNLVKLSMYRKIFVEEFNLDFFKPRKDRCDTCEAFKLLDNSTDAQKESQLRHLKGKALGKKERDKDRRKYKRGIGADVDRVVLCFDMENVMALPRADVSNFFYKRKLNSFNLTAHCSHNGMTYCALWNEAISGRSGNNIASALVKILYAVTTDFPKLKKIVLWSDSCVPQNRNSIMSVALASFIMDTAHEVQVIEQKFSEPGHGLIQEVDAIHSKIERGLQRTEIFSPVTLLRVLVSLSTTRAPLKIIQLKQSDFFNYQMVASKYKYSEIPFTKVKTLKYTFKEILHVSYRLMFSGVLQKVRLNREPTPRASKKQPNKTSPSAPLVTDTVFMKACVLSTPVVLSNEKKKDIRSMYRYMPQVDVNYFKTVLK
jgi:hypothetical protein